MTQIIDTLRTLLSERRDEVEAWLAARFAETPPHITTSVDLRHSGVKIVPVDTNLFPAGFNHLSPAARGRASAAFARALAPYHAQKVLILAESHTRNQGYIDNLYALKLCLEGAAVEVAIATLAVQPGAPQTLATSGGEEVVEYALLRRGDALVTDHGFTPDVVLLNNDLTSGFPDLLHGASTPVLPAPAYGWFQRRKSVHFAAYETLAEQFAAQFGLDSWCLTPLFLRCGQVNFHERTGIECVAMNVEKLLYVLRKKYAEHGITDTPYVFVKADSGTYGMGIMTARSGDEIMEMNKKTRNKMNVIKEGAENHEVIIQEGVATIDRVGEAFAEPMLYLVHGEAVGGAFRVNDARDAYNNLNASGMRFTGMCDEVETQAIADKIRVKSCDFGVYGLMARLAALAAAREHYALEKAA